MSDTYFDDLETRSADARESAQFEALQAQLAHAKSKTKFYGDLFKDLDPATVTDRAALSKLPLTRKHDLIEQQKSLPPFGGLNAVGLENMSRLFQSPGPIFEPQGEGDFWRGGRAFYAAGFRAGDLVHNSFSYHLTPGGWIMDASARAVGCTIFPAGIGNTEQQAAAIAHLKPVAYSGTPSYLKALLDKGAEMGLEMGSICKAMVGGEALPPSLRAEYKDRGVMMYQNFATADLGLVAYESPALEGMICDEGVIVEVVRPGTGEPVEEGEVGELVVTLLGNDLYPLIRFATGDLTAVLPGNSPCGRTNMRIKGWMGRADQTTKIKGMFVHPEQVAEVVKRHDEIKKGRLVVDNADNKDFMVLHCELNGAGSDDLAAAIRDSLSQVCKLKGDVTFVEAGSLANDGKVIDDIRTYE